MDNKNLNDMDKAFKEALQNWEAPYQERDWSDMSALLDGEDGVPFLPLTDPEAIIKTKTIKIWIIMNTLTVISSLIAFNLLTPAGSNNHANKNTIKAVSANTKATAKAISPANKPPKSETIFNQPSNSGKMGENKLVKTVAGKKPAKNRISLSPMAKGGIQEAANELLPLPESGIIASLPQGKDSIQKPKYFKTVTREVWVEDEYEYIYKRPVYDIEDFWIGMYYTQQQPFTPDVWDSMGLRTITHGFNLQFMGGNLLPGEYWAIHGGLDWGMQFYGRSSESEVLINSTSQDKALTYISSNSMDFLARVHAEYARFWVIPYVNAAFGPRIYMTGQKVNSLLNSTQYESNDRHNVAADAALMAGVGAGLRVKLSPRVSVDGRYDMLWGTNMNVVDLKHSQFNGTGYTLSRNNINAGAGQWRVGLVFDLSTEEKEKKLVKPAHYETVTERVYIDPQDSNRVFIPCPCTPCDKKTVIDENALPESNPSGTKPRNGGGIFTPGSGSGSGGGKGSFPGVKAPPVKN